MNNWPEGWAGQQQLPPELDPRRGTREAPTSQPPKQRRRWGRIAAFSALGLVLVLLVSLLTGLAWADKNLQHVDAIEDYEGRPSDTPGSTWLIVGSDSRENLPEDLDERFGTVDGRRADTTMLLHVGSGASFASLVSLPRDSLVTIPPYDDVEEQQGKLNSAYALGGPPLMVRTVELATDLRVDHYMELGFDGVVRMVDAVGGIQVCVDTAVQDDRSGLDLPAGCSTLNGDQALAYVRQRYADPRGDLGRVERQREVLEKVMSAALSPSIVLKPWEAFDLGTVTLDSIRVDQDTSSWDGARLMLSMWRLPDDGLVETTVPIADPDARIRGVGSVVIWDDAGADALFGAIAADERPPVTPTGS